MNQSSELIDNISNSRVMIVDDTPENLDILNQILSEHDYIVQAFPKAKMALEAVFKDPPDLILLDILMPEIDGYNFCKELKKNKSTSSIPVIFLSALFDAEDKIKSFEAGGVDFITKPFHAEEVILRVRSQLTLRHAEKRLLEMNHLLEKQIEQKNLELKIQIENYQSVLENLFGAILGYNETGLIIYVNSTLEELLSQKKEVLQTKHIYQLFTSEQNKNFANWNEFRQYLNKCKEFKVQDLEIPIYVELLEVPLFDPHNTLISYYAGLNNISQRIKNQVNLIEAKKNAERTTKLRRFFLSNINHELRNPLNGAMGMVNLLKPGQSEQEFNEYHSLALRSLNQLKDLVAHILDFSTIDSGKIVLSPKNFDLSETVNILLKTFLPMAKEKALTIEAHGPIELMFYGDPTRINQILSNLLSNAIKFSDKGKVIIEYELNDNLLLKISDQGNGINKKQLEEIYEPFHQLENPYQKEHSGLGLGLNIVKELVHRMNGKIEVVSDKSKGSTFTVSLPITKAATSDNIEEIPKETQEHDYHGLTILVAEDEIINRLYLKQILVKAEVNIVEAANGQIAIEKTQEYHPDIVLMDISMPVMNGMDAIKHLRGIKEFQDLPIYVLTAHTHKEDQKKFLEAGADGVVSKPFYEEEIYAVLEKHKKELV